ncbi:MAG: hypothetical protein JWQ64_3702, partial [Subtercola sp.]|nr:hypothetical protein [Subtercola sp.]
DADYNGDGSADSGSAQFVSASGDLIWTGDIPVGATVVMTASVTVDNPDTGDMVVSTALTTEAVGSTCGTDSQPGCTASVSVLLPALSITTTADTTTALPGAVVTYTTTAVNTGPTVYYAARVTDNLSGALTDGDYDGLGTATRGSLSFDGAQLSWLGDLALGQSVTIVYSITIDDPDLGDRMLVTTVSSAELGSTCAPASTSALCSTGVVVLVPLLTISVNADTTTAVPGDPIDYTVLVTNAGQTDYTDTTVTVDLAQALDDTAGPATLATTIGTATFSAAEIHWNGDLSPGESAIVTYGLSVLNPDTGNRVVTTSASTDAAGGSCGASGDCTNDVNVLIPGLAIAASASAPTTTPGSQVAITISVSNVGQTIYTGAGLAASLAGIVDDAQVVGPISSSTGTANVSAQTLSWAGALTVGQSATISFIVVVDNPDTGDKALASSISSTTPGSTCPPAGSDPACAVSVTVLIPQLTIVKTAGVSTTTPGEVVGYTILVTNTGQTAYEAAAVSDSLAGVLTDADYNLDATVTGGGTLGFTSPTLVWSGALAVGASARITYSITVHDPTLGDKVITNTVTSNAPGSTCTAQTTVPECTAVVRVLVPALLMSISADRATVVAGSAVRYTITLTNTGETVYQPATAVQPLDGILDEAHYNDDASATGGGTVALSDDGTSLVWVGPLALQSSVTITFSVTTDFPATGDLTLTSTLSSPSAGASCQSAAAGGCSTSVEVLIPALSVTKVADRTVAVAGGPVTYTIEATNTGQADYTDADLTDSLSGVLAAATYDDDAVSTVGSISYAAGSLHWHGALVRGATVVITYSVTALVAAPENAILTNSVSSTSTGSTCVTGSTDPRCVVTVSVAARSIGISGLTSSFTLTGLPNSTVTKDGAVTMTVTTNSSGGYLVTVQSETPALTGLNGSNTETIPLQNLGVKAGASTVFVPLSMTPFVVADVTHASAPDGDGVSNDYQVQIPFVPADTYSGTLTYVVSAQ